MHTCAHTGSECAHARFATDAHLYASCAGGCAQIFTKIVVAVHYYLGTLGFKGVDEISPNLNFSQQYLPEIQNWSLQGAIYNFLSVQILKGWLKYFDFQKIEQKKLKQAYFCASFSFFGVRFCG